MGLIINSELSQQIQDIDFAGSSAASSELVKAILLLAHPVGSYYWSSDATNPHDIFGGTWTQIKDKFIIAVGDSHTAGTSYGSNTKDLSHTHTSAAHKHTTGNHTLTNTEVPKHNHTRGTMDIQGTVKPQWGDTSGGGIIMPSGAATGALSTSHDGTAFYFSNQNSSDSSNHHNKITFKASNNWTGSTSEYGTGGAHSHGDTGSTTPGATGSSLSSSFDITPACVAAYCWRRTA